MSQGQTAYSYDASRAVAGKVADNGPNDIITRLAATSLPMGVVVRFTKDATGEVELPTDDTGIIAGVTCYDPMTMQSYPSGSNVITAGRPVAILKRGRVWAVTDGTSMPTTPYAAANVVDATGLVTGSATSSGVVRSANVKFVEASPGTDLGPDGSQKLALVECNLP